MCSVKQMLNYQLVFKETMDLESSLLYFQELSLSTNTVVLKQGKLQHAAVYIIKFRMTSIKTEYLMTCIMQNIPV